MTIPFTFVHAADLHLGTPFAGVGQTSPSTARALRDATLEAFDKLVDLCIEEKALFLLLAGDIYDGPERSIRPLVHFLNGVKKLEEQGIGVFAVAGNHDPRDGKVWSAAGKLPENLHLFPHRPASFTAMADGERVATIHGISYPRREVKEDLAAKLKGAADKSYQIGLLHATVGSGRGHEPYAGTTLEVLRASGMDYWALGHVHTREIVNPSHPVVAYPGNTQALSPREEGARGAFVVRVDREGQALPEFRALDRVRFATAHVDLTEAADLPAALERIRAAILDARDANRGRALILTLDLAGRTSLYASLSAGAGEEEVLETLRAEYEDSDPPLFVNEIENRLSPPLDPEALARRGGFEAQIIEEARALFENPEKLAKLAGEALGPLYAKREFTKLLGAPPTGEALAREWLAARDLALSFFEGEAR